MGVDVRSWSCQVPLLESAKTNHQFSFPDVNRPSPPVAVVHSAPAGGPASTVVGIQTTLMQCIEAAEQKACAQASCITELSDRLAEVEGMVTRLEDSLAESNTTVVRLEDAIMECNAEVESLEGWLAESHTTVVRLEDSLAQSKSELKTSTEQEQKLKQLLQAMDEKLLEQEQDREGMAQELESLQRRFTELQVRCATLRLLSVKHIVL